MNPPGDRGIRELERAVAGGDTDAVAHLIAALRRVGTPVPLELHARFFAIHHPDDHLVTYPSGKQRKVTNLGWLRRQLHRRGGGLTGNLLPLRFVVRTNVGPFPRECYLRVELGDGTRQPLRAGLCQCGELPCKDARRQAEANRQFVHTHTFETMFASCHHLWDWLQTPLFANETLDWDGRVGVIEPRMHESTYGHPSGSEGGPDVECFVCSRRYWSGDEDADPDQPRCPTCFKSGRRRNPDESGRRFERLAAAGDPEASARAIMHKVRSGKIPMANVSLACALAGRRDACLLDPPPYDHQYVLVDRRSLVRWARRLDSMLPGSVTRRIRYRKLNDKMIQWLRGGKKLPPAWPGGGQSVYTDAFHMARARSNRRLHELTKNVIRHYRISVYQRFMDELGGHHGDDRLSPAWDLTDRHGVIVQAAPQTFSPSEGVGFDALRLRRASVRQATDLLGRILLHEA